MLYSAVFMCVLMTLAPVTSFITIMSCINTRLSVSVAYVVVTIECMVDCVSTHPLLTVGSESAEGCGQSRRQC